MTQDKRRKVIQAVKAHLQGLNPGHLQKLVWKTERAAMCDPSDPLYGLMLDAVRPLAQRHGLRRVPQAMRLLCASFEELLVDEAVEPLPQEVPRQAVHALWHFLCRAAPAPLAALQERLWLATQAPAEVNEVEILKVSSDLWALAVTTFREASCHAAVNNFYELDWAKQAFGSLDHLEVLKRTVIPLLGIAQDLAFAKRELPQAPIKKMTDPEIFLAKSVFERIEQAQGFEVALLYLFILQKRCQPQATILTITRSLGPFRTLDAYAGSPFAGTVDNLLIHLNRLLRVLMSALSAETVNDDLILQTLEQFLAEMHYLRLELDWEASKHYAPPLWTLVHRAKEDLLEGLLVTYYDRLYTQQKNPNNQYLNHETLKQLNQNLTRLLALGGSSRLETDMEQRFTALMDGAPLLCASVA